MRGSVHRRPPAIPPPREWSIVPPLLVAGELMAFLACGRSKLDDLIREGLPAIDIGEHCNGGRTRKSLRFRPDEVIAWLQSREVKP